MVVFLSEEELEELEDATLARASKRDKKINGPTMKVDGKSVKLLYYIILEKGNKPERIDRGR